MLLVTYEEGDRTQFDNAFFGGPEVVDSDAAGQGDLLRATLVTRPGWKRSPGSPKRQCFGSRSGRQIDGTCDTGALHAQPVRRFLLRLCKGGMLLAAAAFAVYACSNDVPADAQQPATTTTTAQPAPESIGAGELVWDACPPEAPSDVSCGRVGAPLIYSSENGVIAEVAFAVTRATGPAPVGYLFVNPGGPGVSAREMVFNSSAHLAPDLLERFDVVGVDPRGVGGSVPAFSCGDRDKFMDVFAEASTSGDFAAGERAVRLCIDTTGPTSSVMHTEYAARDMDAVRVALGASQISYYGASYGSLLGLWYATLFDDHVRVMVLDGAINPNHDASTSEARVERDFGRLAPIDQRLAEALKACDGDDCPIRHGGDQIGWFLNNADRTAVVADHFDGFGPAPALAMVTPLYAEAFWPVWHTALDAAVTHGDGSALARFAALQLLEGDLTGEWSAWTATAHINCLDSWIAAPGLSAEERIRDADSLAEQVEQRLPLLAAIPDLGWAYDLCPFYENDLRPPASSVGELNGGDAAIMVIGNRSDPVTPIADAESLAGVMRNSTLLTTDHPQHVAYPTDPCVIERVHVFLIDMMIIAGGCDT